MAGEHGGVSALRVTPNDVALRCIRVREVLGHAHNVKDSMRFAFANDVGMATGGGETFVVGGDNEIARVEESVRHRHEFGWLERRRARVGNAGCSVRPRDDRPAATWCGALRDEDKTSDGDVLAVDVGRVVHDSRHRTVQAGCVD